MPFLLSTYHCICYWKWLYDTILYNSWWCLVSGEWWNGLSVKWPRPEKHSQIQARLLSQATGISSYNHVMLVHPKHVTTFNYRLRVVFGLASQSVCRPSDDIDDQCRPRNHALHLLYGESPRVEVVTDEKSLHNNQDSDMRLRGVWVARLVHLR